MFGFFYLHESVAIINEWSMCDPLEDLADVWQRLGPLDHSLIVVDQCQSYPEQDFRALVEQAIPNPKNCLQEKKKKHLNKLLLLKCTQ